ncbi:MAG: hypothetical protein ACI9OJ_004109, partial [Myxococcota bacterium]
EVKPATVEAVTKAAGENARTVAELFAQRDELKGKTVTVRGKVTKFNSSIMDRNWVHIQDGSGSAESKDNDLTVTTDGSAIVGKIVVVTGTLVTDQDFGSGYTYPLLVEKAKIAAE